MEDPSIQNLAQFICQPGGYGGSRNKHELAPGQDLDRAGAPETPERKGQLGNGGTVCTGTSDTAWGTSNLARRAAQGSNFRGFPPRVTIEDQSENLLSRGCPLGQRVSFTCSAHTILLAILRYTMIPYQVVPLPREPVLLAEIQPSGRPSPPRSQDKVFPDSAR